MSKEKRRTHSDPIVARSFEGIAEYWADNEERRRYSIPFSDGAFFSDGSGFSNGAAADNHFEVLQRLQETIARLETIEALLSQEVATPTSLDNQNFTVSLAEVRADIASAKTAYDEINQDPIDPGILRKWADFFAHLSGKFILRALGLANIFLDNFASEAGKSIGKTAGTAVLAIGGIGWLQYQAGVDLDGVVNAIEALIKAQMTP